MCANSTTLSHQHMLTRSAVSGGLKPEDKISHPSPADVPFRHCGHSNRMANTSFVYPIRPCPNVTASREPPNAPLEFVSSPCVSISEYGRVNPTPRGHQTHVDFQKKNFQKGCRKDILFKAFRISQLCQIQTSLLFLWGEIILKRNKGKKAHA